MDFIENIEEVYRKSKPLKISELNDHGFLRDREIGRNVARHISTR